MVLYCVSIQIDRAVHDDWLAWMQEAHIPDVMRTGCFLGCTLSRVVEPEGEGLSYRIQYSCRSMDDFNLYKQTYATVLRVQHSSRYPRGFRAIRELHEVVNEFKPDCKPIVMDGVLDQRLWNESTQKILFLLKEAYLEQPKEIPDLRVWIRRWVEKGGKKRRKTWKVLSEWAFLAQHAGDDEPLTLLKKSNFAARGNALLSCAIVNVKKAGGKKKSKQKELKKAAEENREQLLEQISGIGPRIIICGNTWNAFKRCLNLSKKDYEPQHRIDDYYLSQLTRDDRLNGCKVINFCHPAHQYSKKRINKTLVSLLQG
jgi:hypothetical protein